MSKMMKSFINWYEIVYININNEIGKKEFDNKDKDYVIQKMNLLT